MKDLCFGLRRLGLGLLRAPESGSFAFIDSVLAEMGQPCADLLSQTLIYIGSMWLAKASVSGIVLDSQLHGPTPPPLPLDGSTRRCRLMLR